MLYVFVICMVTFFLKNVLMYKQVTDKPRVY